MTAYQRRPYFAPTPSSGRALPWWLLPLLALLGLLSLLAQTCGGSGGSSAAGEPDERERQRQGCPPVSVVAVVDSSTSVREQETVDVGAILSQVLDDHVVASVADPACPNLGVVWFADIAELHLLEQPTSKPPTDLGDGTDLVAALTLARSSMPECPGETFGAGCGTVVVISDFVALPTDAINDALTALLPRRLLAVHVGESYPGYDSAFEKVFE